MDKKEFNIKTKCIHTDCKKFDITGSVSLPIFQSATFAHSNGINTGYDYSRLQNPTREHLECLLTNLEGGVDSIAFSTGMAAITCLMEIFKPGDHIIAGHDLYGGTHRLFDNISSKNGIQIEYIETSNLDNVITSIKRNTKAIFIETPSNPMMHISDIKAISKIAKDNNLLLIVDNTFLTPYFQRPIELGADIVVHSGTKYLGGHNDTLAGFLVTNNLLLSEKLRFIYKTTGACLSPFDSWLIIRGIKTLALRMKQQEKNAMTIATWLSSHKNVTKVFYTGLENHPGHKICKSQSSGFGSILSFNVISEDIAINVLKKVELITYAESLGGTETLITYPLTQTHADVPENERIAKGINNTLLRLSVGIEDVEDLINDLNNALGE